MVKTILENWGAALAIMGGIAMLFAVIIGGLLIWKKAGGGDIKAGPVDIDVDGKTEDKQ